MQVIKGLLLTLLGLPSLNLELLELCAALVLVGLLLLWWKRRRASTDTEQQGSETSEANRELEGLREEVARLATQIKELQEQRECRSAEADTGGTGRKDNPCREGREIG